MIPQRTNKLDNRPKISVTRTADIFRNRYIRMMLISFITALIMIMTLFGIYGMIIERELPVPHYSILLLVFAIFFIVIFEFFDSKRIVNRLGAGILGFVIAFCLTIILASLIESVKMAMFQTYADMGIGWEMIITGLAVCMIISIIIIKTLLTVVERE